MNQPQIPGFHVYRATNTQGKPDRTILSPLSPEDVRQVGGLRDEAVIGEVIAPGPGLNPNNFVPNPAFAQFLHKVLAIHAPRCPGLMDAVKETGTGTILILDKRSQTHPTERDTKDILATVEVKDGRLSRYVINPQHQLVTDHGFTVLDPWYQEKLIEELRKLPYQPSAGPAVQPGTQQ
ncbi:MAG: hypothetical protein JWO87_552 [Phycisphaerales bacterium]|jgi:hypothetical protein|nr:hypothetical protein [Phycisphaerales bacterium]MDB5298889.1 hypothetical protein [Phycisphaerales bacterium]MDB5305635.1 hypothetical protein [Phycisphaerales bacterium]